MRYTHAAAILALILPVTVQAEYPAQLGWTNNEATLEFRKSGDKYCYREPNDDTPCGEIPGPLIRMTKGAKYKLILKNTAEDSSIHTNIHTHGLHIVGDGDGDDVTRYAHGGECLDYTWDIGQNHPPGTYWYHPHYHTLTTTQTSGGAFGMLIIDDDESAGDFPFWAHRANEKLLMISDVGTTLLANGSNSEVVELATDKWYRLRVSVVVPGARPANLSFPADCTVYKVASDGVWHNKSFATYSGTSFELTGASRADFAIKCSAGGGIKWGQSTAASIQVDPTFSGGMDGDDLGVAPSRPSCLQIDTNEAPGGSFSIALSGASINGQTWDENTGLGDISFDEVQEWTISGSGAHPFHLHLYHMLIVTPGGCGAHAEGEFYDTLSGPTCTVRFKTADFGQRMIMHCHVLSHEDNGAISWMNVAGVPEGQMNVVDSPSYTCVTQTPYECSTDVCSSDADCCDGYTCARVRGSQSCSPLFEGYLRASVSQREAQEVTNQKDD